MMDNRHRGFGALLLAVTLLLTACVPTPAVTTWPAPKDGIEQRAGAAGLQLLPEGKLAEHIHAHLTITVNGKPVTVPAHIGIDTKADTYSEIHTHNTSGIIHIESRYRGHFYLHQFFTEWNVPLHEHGVGMYVNDNAGVKVTTFVNSQVHTGSLTKLELANLQDIVIAITTDGSAPNRSQPFIWPRNYIPLALR